MALYRDVENGANGVASIVEAGETSLTIRKFIVVAVDEVTNFLIVRHRPASTTHMVPYSSLTGIARLEKLYIASVEAEFNMKVKLTVPNIIFSC